MVSDAKILKAIPKGLKKADVPNLGKKIQGKVRDSYVAGDIRVIISTDRVSAFDRVLGAFPYRGSVLTQLSQFWFKKTSDIIQNHALEVIHPNVMVVKNAKLIPIEMVVRGYITGVTDTSIWGSYEKGERVIYGIKFPDGLKKNQELKDPVITPTTKAESGHDERLTEKEILAKKIVTPAIWRQMKKAALEVFERGSKICNRAGIILVDTKYEFGILNGKLILIDEIHTPDSSRYWVKETYKDRFKKGMEPESYDKELMRIWFKEHGYKGEGKPPKMPESFILKMSKRYISIYEKITGEKFNGGDYPLEKSIKEAVKNYLKNA